MKGKHILLLNEIFHGVVFIVIILEVSQICHLPDSDDAACTSSKGQGDLKCLALL